MSQLFSMRIKKRLKAKVAKVWLLFLNIIDQTYRRKKEKDQVFSIFIIIKHRPFELPLYLIEREKIDRKSELFNST